MNAIDQICAYIEHENRRHVGPDNFTGWFLDGITQQIDNSSARLLLNYLASGEDKKAADLLRDFFTREYSENAQEHFSDRDAA